MWYFYNLKGSTWVEDFFVLIFLLISLMKIIFTDKKISGNGQRNSVMSVHLGLVGVASNLRVGPAFQVTATHGGKQGGSC